MQGRSLLPLVRGETRDDDEVFVQISESQVGRALRTRRWKYSVAAPGLSGSQHPSAAEYCEDALYDLERDPYELNNLVGDENHGGVRRELQAALQRQMARAGEAPAVIRPLQPRPA